MKNSGLKDHIIVAQDSTRSRTSMRTEFRDLEGDGSITLQAKEYLRPLYQEVKCGWLANKFGIIVLWGLGILLLGAFVWCR
jgi:hypothetical protein